MPHAPARKKGLIPLVIATVAGLVAAALLLTPASGDPRDPERSVAGATRDASQPPVDPADDPLTGLVRRDADEVTAIGDVDAPVVMLNYSEFQCPFCGKFARSTERTLVEKYVEDGTLRIEWRDFPYLGEESTRAAVAARAAGEQGKFWEFHDALFADQAPPNSGSLTEDHLVGVASDLGLDAERFRTDMSSRTIADAVARDFSEGQQIGVTGTPAFVVNGRPIIGAQPTEVFVDAIEEAAEAAR